MKRDYALLLFLLPGIVFLIFFRYAPMYGIVTAFQDYNIFKGIAHSPWVGLKHFKILFSSSDFKRILINTIRISAGKLLFTLGCCPWIWRRAPCMSASVPSLPEVPSVSCCWTAAAPFCLPQIRKLWRSPFPRRSGGR